MNQELGPKLVSCRVCGVIMVRLARDVCSKCFAAEETVLKSQNLPENKSGSQCC